MTIPRDEWSSAIGDDSLPITEEIHEFLHHNRKEAYSAAEIACRLADHHDGVKDPSRSVGELSVQELGGLASQTAHVKAILDMLDKGGGSLKVRRVEGIDYYQLND